MWAEEWREEKKKKKNKKKNDPGRIRTCNLLIRSQAPYPLGHGTLRIHGSSFSSIILKTYRVQSLQLG